MPLADANGPIAAILEHIGERNFVQIHPAFILWEKYVRNADAGGIAAGEQSRARRRADRIGGREIGESHAGGSHAIEVGCGNLRAVAAQIAVAQIVAKNEDDVGWWRWSSVKARCQCGRQGCEKGTAMDHSRIIILADVARPKPLLFGHNTAQPLKQSPDRLPTPVGHFTAYSLKSRCCAQYCKL